MAAIYVPLQWPRHNLHPLPRLKPLVEVKPVRPNMKQPCIHKDFSKLLTQLLKTHAKFDNKYCRWQKKQNKQKRLNHILFLCSYTDNTKHIAVINESPLFPAIHVLPWRLRPWVIAQINTDLRIMKYIFNT